MLIHNWLFIYEFICPTFINNSNRNCAPAREGQTTDNELADMKLKAESFPTLAHDFMTYKGMPRNNIDFQEGL